jgi:hypothetical protein
VAEAKAQIDEMLRHLRAGDGQPGSAPRPDDLEQFMKVLGEAAKRTDNPELRTRFEGAIQKIRGAAERGDPDAVRAVMKSIEPALRETMQSR